MSEQKTKILALLKELGITVESEFVPYSKSRLYKKDAKINDMGLNWLVTVKCGGREVLTTDYGAGIAHCPSYKQSFRGMSVDMAAAVKYECERGVENTGLRKKILPDTCDVIHCLLGDAEAADHKDFEDWCRNTGYNVDSRSDEKCYLACLKIGLQMNNGIGADALRKLREAYQDY